MRKSPDAGFLEVWSKQTRLGGVGEGWSWRIFLATRRLSIVYIIHQHYIHFMCRKLNLTSCSRILGRDGRICTSLCIQWTQFEKIILDFVISWIVSQILDFQLNWGLNSLNLFLLRLETNFLNRCLRVCSLSWVCILCSFSHSIGIS